MKMGCATTFRVQSYSRVQSSEALRCAVSRTSETRDVANKPARQESLVSTCTNLAYAAATSAWLAVLWML